MTENDEGSLRTASELDGFAFRCTYCDHLASQRIRPADLGLAAGEDPVPTHVYPYSGCSCGHGRFVVAELRDGFADERAGGLRLDEPAAPPADSLHARVASAEYRKLPIRQVRPNPRQPRKFFDRAALQSLADSIRQVGLLEDVLVRPLHDGYELVLGERRWRAAQAAGLDEISAKVVALTDEDVRRIALIENVQREDLTEVEEAFAYKGFLDQGMRQRDVADAMGRLGDRVAQRLKVLSSNYYVEYQERRIADLTNEVERLRGRLDERQAQYEVVTANAGSLTRLLEEGYELVTALPDDRYVLRKRR